MALGVLRAHGAGFQILNRPEGGTSTRAFFALPVEEPVAETPAPVSGHGILLAEDDVSLRELLAEVLQAWGYAPVLQARDGSEAVERFRHDARKVGLFLTDADMPRMSGPQALAAIRRLQPDLPAVMMTAGEDEAGECGTDVEAFAAIFHKPFSLEDLRSTLKRLLG